MLLAMMWVGSISMLDPSLWYAHVFLVSFEGFRWLLSNQEER